MHLHVQICLQGIKEITRKQALLHLVRPIEYAIALTTFQMTVPLQGFTGRKDCSRIASPNESKPHCVDDSEEVNNRITVPMSNIAPVLGQPSEQ
jgi:hypothetical protein